MRPATVLSVLQTPCVKVNDFSDVSVVCFSVLWCLENRRDVNYNCLYMKGEV